MLPRFSSLLLGSYYQTFLFLCFTRQSRFRLLFREVAFQLLHSHKENAKSSFEAGLGQSPHLVPGLLLNFSHCVGVFLFLRRCAGFFASTSRGILALPKLGLVPSQILVHLFPFSTFLAESFLRTKLNFVWLCFGFCVATIPRALISGLIVLLAFEGRYLFLPQYWYCLESLVLNRSSFSQIVFLPLPSVLCIS